MFSELKAVADRQGIPPRDPATDAARLAAMAEKLQTHGATISVVEFYGCFGILMEREAKRMQNEAGSGVPQTKTT